MPALRDLMKVRGIEAGVPLPVQPHDARDLRDGGPARRGLPPPPIPQPVIADPLVRRRQRRSVRGRHPKISSACSQVSLPLIACISTSWTFIVRSTTAEA